MSENSEELGTQIGPYNLLSVLGEGGFGIVYLAKQKEPFRRQVALKVIKPGMDSKQVIARFEAERQALALLDHPNIVQILDGGTTEAGQPYFVMEFVKGLPITEYCDKKKLSIEKRLELFQQVCWALQHAHEKGIIHRGLKPSDILVSDREDKPTPKVIDFGIAKTIQPLTERTLFDEQGQIFGTPEYMSPEQTGTTIHGIDQRSDIYSLGIVLYELLIGTLPFDWEALHGVTFDVVFKTIRDEDPPRPSVRLLDIGTKPEPGSAKRRRDVRRLSKRLHKELEWIPMKAMQKEPDHRYRTASEVANDIWNYLNGFPLIAGPNSGTYRARKYMSRNARLIVLVALIFFSMLLAGLFGTLYFLEKARGG